MASAHPCPGDGATERLIFALRAERERNAALTAEARELRNRIREMECEWENEVNAARAENAALTERIEVDRQDVRRLMDERDAARAENARLAEVQDLWKRSWRQAKDDATVEYERMRAEVERLTAEVEVVRSANEALNGIGASLDAARAEVERFTALLDERDRVERRAMAEMVELTTENERLRSELQQSTRILDGEITLTQAGVLAQIEMNREALDGTPAPPARAQLEID